MEKIMTDISTFANLRRKDGYTYVDKTDLMGRLVANTVERRFFIAAKRNIDEPLFAKFA